jgi:hypothetical protein
MGWFFCGEKNEAGLYGSISKVNLDYRGSFWNQPGLPAFKCQFEPEEPYSIPFSRTHSRLYRKSKELGILVPNRVIWVGFFGSP